MSILWCSQSRDRAIYQIWKLPKKNSIYLVSQWNLSLNNGNFWIFSTFEIWWIWERFSMNILHSRVFCPNFFHKKIGELFPQNGKISWIYTRETHFPKTFFFFFFKNDPNISKKRNHYFLEGRTHFSKLKLSENLPVK